MLTVAIVSSYLASVNADPALIGLVASIPFVSQLIQIPFAALAENFSRKKVSFVASLISRFSLLLIAVACLVGSITWFVVFFVIFNVFKEIAAVA